MHLTADNGNHLLRLLVLVNVLSLSSLIVEVLLEELVRVKSESSLGDEGGHKDKTSDDGELNTGGHLKSLTDVTTLISSTAGVDTVEVTSEKRGGDGVENDVDGVQESHDGTEGRDVAGRSLHAGKSSLNVGSKGNISGSPSERDRQEGGSDHPGVLDGSRGGGPEGNVPDDHEHESVKTQPGDRSLDEVGEQEDEKGSEKLSKVGSSDHDLSPSRVSEVTLGDLRANSVLEVTVSVPGNC
jgi:hypothetical protein